MAEVVVAVKSVDRGSQNIQSFGDKLSKLGMSALGINSAMQVASAAMNAFTGTVQGAWRALGEGAALTTAQGNFDRLAESIGTTSDALRNDLTAATQGMVSQAQLMASASELMALGLTRTHDQTVRLGSVAGQLGWNMQHLILELNNMSGLRLDALGLELDKVKAKAKEFEAAGMSAKEAYAEAVITMGEQKLDIIQLSDAEKAMRQLTTAAEDAGNAFKIAFAQGLSDNMQDLAGGAMAMGDSWKYAAQWAGEYAAIVSGFVLRGVTAAGMREEMNDLRESFIAAGGSMAEFDERYKGIFDMSGRLSVEQLSLVIQQLEADIAALKDAAAYANPELRQMEQWGGIPKEKIRSVTEWTDEAKKAALAAAELSDFNISGVEGATQSGIWAVAGAHIQGILDAAEAEAAEAADKIAQELGEAFHEAAASASSAFTSAIADLKDVKAPDLLDIFGNFDSGKVNEAIMGMAQSSGAAVSQLGALGVALGEFTPAMAEAATKAALFQGALEGLTKQWVLGKIDTSAFLGAIEEVQGILAGSLADVQTQLENSARGWTPVSVPAQVDWVDGDPTVATRDPIHVAIQPTIATDALQQALDPLDGIMAEKTRITFDDPDTTAVTRAIDTIIADIDSLPAVVTFDDPDTSAFDAEIRRIEALRPKVFVEIVPLAPPDVGSGGSGGGGTPGNPARSGGGKSGGTNINMNVNFSGQVTDPRRVVSSIKQGLSDFYADLLQEGVNW